MQCRKFSCDLEHAISEACYTRIFLLKYGTSNKKCSLLITRRASQEFCCTLGPWLYKKRFPFFRVISVHRMAMVTFGRTFHHGGKISPAWWGRGLHGLATNGNVKWIMQQKSFAVEIRDMQYYSITYINNPLLPLEILRIQLGTLHVF